MRSKLFCLILFLLALSFCEAQKTVVLDTSMFDKNYQTIFLGGLDGWIFHEGNDLHWAAKNVDTTGWEKYTAKALFLKNTDHNGRAEGWFRLRFSLDSSFSNIPIALHLNRWLAMDVYIDGTYIASLGNTGINGKTYEEGRSFLNPGIPLSLKPGIEYVIAVHAVDHAAPLNPRKLKSEVDATKDAVYLAGPENQYRATYLFQELSVYYSTYTSVCFVLCLLFWFLYFQNRSEKVLFFIALGMSFFAFNMLCIFIYSVARDISFFVVNLSVYCADIFLGSFESLVILIFAAVFKRKIKRFFIPVLLVIPIYAIVINQYTDYIPLPSYIIGALSLLPFVIYLYLIISSWKNLKGAQWSIIAGAVATFIFMFIFLYNLQKHPVWPWPFCYLYMGGTLLSFPLSLMIYVAMRFKEMLNDVRRNANEVLKITEEKREILAHQNELLEQQVEERTRELKASQAQLIQSEKMASLGELTAGIAHEIQNPLNFVNNFSDINNELIDELKEELATGNLQLATEIAEDIKQNEAKINHHGKRADAIVKGMLQHSRMNTGHKEPTDINRLADEYLRLAYHGMRAKDKEFNADLKTEFDEGIGKINIIAQDIGRVLLNLYNNAFYAVKPPSSLKGEHYSPLVRISTKKINDKIEIRVADNGSGIPQKIVDKIFQPFFTTKPTGQGTGLGLSLSYDIVKAHGGEIKVETKEGEGSEFIILFPVV